MLRTNLGLIVWLGLGVFVTAAAAQQPPAPATAGKAGSGRGMTNTYPPGTPLLEFDEKTVPRIHAADLMAKDVEQSAKYYQDVFGMKLYMRRASATFDSMHLAFPSVGSNTLMGPTLRIMKDANFVATRTLPSLVIFVEDPAPYVKRAAEAGFPATRITATSAYFPDPSGNIIEVLTATSAKPILGPALVK